MHITLLALGTRGHVQPYVALGAGLAARGYRVTVAAHTAYGDLVTDAGLKHAPVTVDFFAALRQMRERSADNATQTSTRFMRDSRQAFQPLTRRLLAESWSAALDADAVIYGLMGFAGPHIAEKRRIPAIAAYVHPLTRTRDFPAMFAPQNVSLGGWYNLLTHRLTEQFMWQPIRQGVNAWRRETLGLPPAPFWGPGRPQPPVLYAFSRHVVSPPADWPDNVHVTGEWWLRREGAVPSADLTRFLDAGPPPIYIGFGAMMDRNPLDALRTIVDAVHRSGQRALLQVGDQDVSALDLPPSIRLARHEPHDLLLPHCTVAVHHGGSGTTLATLRHGKPTIVLPGFADQPFWGKRVAALGAGPAPIPLDKLTVANLADAIRTAVSDATMRERAIALSRKLRAEDGVATAVEWVEHYVGRAARRAPAAARSAGFLQSAQPG